MKFEDFLKILLSGGSLTLGAFLTAVRGKLTSLKRKNMLYVIFYVVAVAVAIAAVGGFFVYYGTIFHPQDKSGTNWAALTIIGISIISAGLLIWFTKKHLAGKYQYKTRELDPVVNKFTINSDKSNIRLLAGDLNFFGSTPQAMDNNSQYTCLRNENFRAIQILCFKPRTNVEKIRYGKIISELPAEIRYYNPPAADLNVRGRMKTLNNVTHLLIYNKVSSGSYEALELDTADANGALYNHIWNLVWQLAEPALQDELNEYVSLFRN